MNNIIEGNMIIAEFMKLPKLTDTTWISPVMASSTPELHYHDSWGWLMPVIEYISKHRYVNLSKPQPDVNVPVNFQYSWPVTFGMISEEGYPMVRIKYSSLHQAPTLIEAAFNAVVEWIEFYEPEEIVFDPMPQAI